MRLRTKLYLVVLPLLAAAEFAIAAWAWGQSASALTGIVRASLAAKSVLLEQYAALQAEALLDSGAFSDAAMRDAAIAGIEQYALGLLDGEAEIIAGLDETGTMLLFAGTEARRKDGGQITGAAGKSYLVEAGLAGAFGLRLYTACEKRAALRPLGRIIIAAVITALVTLFASAVLLHFLARLITSPLNNISRFFNSYSFSSGKDKPESPALKAEYNDETGDLAAAFNIMMSRFSATEQELKNSAQFALEKAESEEKRRALFQLYAPHDIVQKTLRMNKKEIAGQKYNGVFLYSRLEYAASMPLSRAVDRMPPAQFIDMMGRYQGAMTQIVEKTGGLLFNYGGGALLAGWGAPLSKEKDCRDALYAALLMIDALREFNEANEKEGLPPLNAGIGLDGGFAAAGSAGAAGKMFFAAAGTPVSQAERAEALTLRYKEAVLFTEHVYKKNYAAFPCRFVDKVVLEEGGAGTPLYTARLQLTQEETESWKHYRIGVKLFYTRKWSEALLQFEQSLLNTPEDSLSSMFASRCRKFLKTPPPPSWDGSSEAE